MEQFTKTYAPWVALLSFLLSVVIALTQYRSSQRSSHVQATFEFLKDHKSTENVTRRNGLSAKIEAIRRALDVEKVSNPDFDFGVRYKAEVKRLFSDPQVDTAFFSILAQYDLVAACATNGLCDEDAAIAFFYCDARTFAEAYYSKLESIWEKQRGDGREMMTWLRELKRTRPTLPEKCRAPE